MSIIFFLLHLFDFIEFMDRSLVDYHYQNRVLEQRMKKSVDL